MFVVVISPNAVLAQKLVDKPQEANLLVMGPGTELFSLFGHAALSIRYLSGRHLVYNFGYSDFTRPQLLPELLRGTARFWAVSDTIEETLNYYRSKGRAVYKRRLLISDEELLELDRILRRAIHPLHRYYVYHHFRDNCSTRVRDVLNRITDGGLERNSSSRTDYTYRQLVEQGFAESIGMLLATSLFLGRKGDGSLTRWDLAFLPQFLSETASEYLHRGQSLAGSPVLLSPESSRSSPERFIKSCNDIVVVLLGIILLFATSGLIVRPHQRVSRWLLRIAFIPSAISGTLVWIVSLYTVVPELRYNENALLLWPTDLLFVWSGAKASSSTVVFRWTQRYCWLRVASCLLGLLLHLFGVFYQRPIVWSLVGALPAACFLLIHRSHGNDAERKAAETNASS